MPRDSSGNYSLPAGNPVVGGTTITATWANPTMTDIGDELTNSLDRNGRGGMLAAFKFADGLVGAPGITWNAEPTSGIFRAGGNDMQAVIAGVPRMRWTASTVDVWDTGTSTWLPIIGPSGSNFALTDSPNTFTDVNTFEDEVWITGAFGLAIESDAPQILFAENGVAADNRNWYIYVDASVMTFSAWNSAETLSTNYFAITRSSQSITNVSFGNATSNPTYSFLGTGATTFGGSVTFTGQIVGSGSGGSGALRLTSASPSIVWTESDAAADTQSWRARVNGNAFTLAAVNDAFSTQSDILIATRTLAVVSQIRFGGTTDNPVFQFLGTGSVTSGGVHIGPVGAVGAPTYSFTGDATTGVYRSASSEVSIACAGVQKLAVGPLGQYNIDGTFTNPAITFINDQDTGIYRGGTNSISVSAGAGTNIFSVDSTEAAIAHASLPQLSLYVGAAQRAYFQYDNGAVAAKLDSDGQLLLAANNTVGVTLTAVASPAAQFNDGTNSLPSVTFSADPDTGFYRIGSDALGFAEGGTGYRIGFRPVPVSATTTTLAIGDVGKCVPITAAIAIPVSVFAAGDAVSIYNNSAGSLNVTMAAGTLRLAGTTTASSPRALAARGMATLWFLTGGATPEVIIGGPGVT